MCASLRANRFSFAILLTVLVLLPQAGAGAQDAPQFSLVSEFSLGDLCPESGVASPDGSVIWVLQYDCIGDYAVSIQAFSVADGTPVGEPIGPFDMEISGSEMTWMDAPIMVLHDDGTLTVDFVDTWDTGTTASFTVNTATGAITRDADSPRVLTPDAIFAAVPDFTGITDVLRYSADRSLALTQDDQALFVFDVASEQVVLRVVPPGSFDDVGSLLGPNSKHLYGWVMQEPGNYDNPAGTLYVWDIASGELVSATEYPYFPSVNSPDERFSVVGTVPCCENVSIAVMDLANGSVSESLPTRTRLDPMEICKSTGRPTNNIDWASDDPVERDLIWLPDSSGFVTLNSDEFWQGSCRSNDSRMRVYSVTG
jgi:hypothetical protein